MKGHEVAFKIEFAGPAVDGLRALSDEKQRVVQHQLGTVAIYLERFPTIRPEQELHVVGCRVHYRVDADGEQLVVQRIEPDQAVRPLDRDSKPGGAK